MITITCDCCEGEIYDTSKRITLSGGENGNQLNYNSTFEQELRPGRKLEFSRHHDLHFCSEAHFVEFFMGKNYVYPKPKID